MLDVLVEPQEVPEVEARCLCSWLVSKYPLHEGSWLETSKVIRCMRFLSLLRLDGHLGPYRWPHPFSKGKKSDKPNDCLHWCLPGPIDSWNDVIMQMAVDG
ncbi:hypothetical protein Droror1_Dr00017995 [Drosera rotundifolia]